MSKKTKSVRKSHKHTFREEKNMAFDSVITGCYEQFMYLNDVCLSNCRYDLSSLESVQNYLYETAMEAACCIIDEDYDIDSDIRLLRMRQVTNNF